MVFQPLKGITFMLAALYILLLALIASVADVWNAMALTVIWLNVGVFAYGMAHALKIGFILGKEHPDEQEDEVTDTPDQSVQDHTHGQVPGSPHDRE